MDICMGYKSKLPDRETGFRFGEWEVIRSDHSGKYPTYICLCTGCNTERVVDKRNLENGWTKSCIPCANKRLREERGSIYLQFDSPRKDIDRIANVYYAIVSRCRGKGYGSHRYGGRGISCEFSDVYDFIGYVRTLSGWDNSNLQIDRIDNDGNYTRGNLRFVTSKTNNRNKAGLRWITYQNETISASEFWERFCPTYRDKGTVARKIRNGFSAEQIIADQSKCKGAYLRCAERRAAKSIHDSNR